MQKPRLGMLQAENIFCLGFMALQWPQTLLVTTQTQSFQGITQKSKAEESNLKAWRTSDYSRLKEGG